MVPMERRNSQSLMIRDPEKGDIMASVETVECSNCGAPLPAEQEVCRYCGSHLIVKRDTKPAPTGDPSSLRKYPSQRDNPRVEQKESEPASGCATVFSFLIGTGLTFLSFYLFKEGSRTGFGALNIFVIPLATAFIWFSLVNWFPKLKGWGTVQGGLVIAAATYFSLWDSFSDNFWGYVIMGVFFLIALIMIIFGIANLLPSSKPKVPKEPPDK